MILLRIKLKHFRSHKNTVLQLQRVTFFRGLNKSGKTSIAMAIAMVLSGRCEVTDEAGKGFEQLIEEGAQTALIVLEFDTATITLQLDRTNGRNLKVETDNRTIVGRQAQEWIHENLAPADVVSACLDAWRFMRMSDNEQASLLARVLLPAELPIQPEVADWLQANRLTLIQKATLFQTIEATYKTIAAARTDVGRKITPLKNIEEPDAPATSRNEVKAKIGDIEREKENIAEQLRTFETQRDAINRAETELKWIHNKIEEQQEVSSKQPAPLSSDERQKLLKTDARRLAIQKLQRNLETAKRELDQINAIIDKLSDDTEAGTCPTCKQALTEEIRRVIFGPLLEKQTEISRNIHGIDKQLRADSDPDEARRLLEQDNEARDAQARIAETITELKQRADACRKTIELSQPNGTPATESDLQGRYQELEQLRVKHLDELVKVVEQEQKVNEYNRQTTERTAAEARLSELEKLLEYFGPTGIKAQLIAERIDTFTEKVNAVLAWWNYSIRFSIEPYKLWIAEDVPNAATLTPNQLSDSETYRLGIAFAVAMAEWTGFGMLIADAAEILDRPDKWQLAQLLLHSDLNQAIITSTGLAGTFEAAGTAFYTLSKDDGFTAFHLDEEQEAAEVPVGA